METNKILQADLLDILFDGKNKNYGAYDLRRTYNKRMATALGATGAVLLLFFVGSVLANVMNKKVEKPMEVASEIELKAVEPPKKDIPELPPPPAIKVTPPPQVQMSQFTPPRIVQDQDVTEDDKPPVVDDLADTKIGTADVKGDADDGVSAPPPATGTGLSGEGPVTQKLAIDEIFTSVQIPARFPGGADAWRRYLERDFRYPEEAQEQGIQGVVTVQMVVDKLGNITEVKALNDLGGGTAAEAERVVKKGGKWLPAEQNGNHVSYKFTQKVTFVLQ